jgi:hypothetical protein
MDYLQLAREHRALTFRLDGFQENHWTKPEVFEALNVSRTTQLSDQRLATVLVFNKSAGTRDLVDEWAEASLFDGGYLLNNDSQNSHAVPGFKAHRNDQSLWSVISKERGVPSISDETFFAPDWDLNGANFPFWATRLRSVFSRPNPTFVQKVASRFIRMIP